MSPSSSTPQSAYSPVSRNFLAIDFETANYESDSACSIGLVRVENNQIVETAHHLIQPPYRNFVFTYIHGITWEHVESEPAFLDVWPKILPLLEGVDFLVAHNARFDKKVLQACCERYQLAPPQMDFRCTVQLARKNLGIYPTNLPAVCRVLDIPLKHHDASSDALACAKIAIAALELETPESELARVPKKKSKPSPRLHEG